MVKKTTAQNIKLKQEARDEHKNNLINNLKKYGDDFNLPQNINFVEKDMHSCFDLSEAISDVNLFDPNINYTPDKIDLDEYYTRQIKLFLLPFQSQVIEKWFDMYILMYNITVRYIKRKRYFDLKIPTLTKIKSDLCKEKDKIQKISKIQISVDDAQKEEKETQLYRTKKGVVTIIYKKRRKQKVVEVDRHLLDYALNDAYKAYQSCMTNFKKGNIKHFRLRCLKFTKPNKIIKIEKLAFRDKTFYQSILGNVVHCSVKDFNYVRNIHTVAILTKRNEEYFLLLKYPKKDKATLNISTIGIDLGVRPVATGYSNKGIVEIGKNTYDKIKKRLQVIDKIEKHKKEEMDTNDNLREKESISKMYDKVKNKKYTKIKNMVNDMHWKIVKYLTENFNNILLGNLSTKKIGEGNLNPMVKRVGNMLALFQFRQKLKYKCKHNKINFKLTDESYTTQCCGKCGNLKKDLKGNKEYKCKECGFEEKRDINSARLITIASLN